MQRNNIQFQKKETPFQTFFLQNDLTLEVEVKELQEVNFKELKSRLEKGRIDIYNPKTKTEFRTKLHCLQKSGKRTLLL